MTLPHDLSFASNRIGIVKPLAVLLLGSAVSCSIQARDLRILVDGIDPTKGKVHCALFSDERGFPFTLERSRAHVSYPAEGPLLTCTFPNVEPGRYAVSAFHDLDGDAAFDGRFDGDSAEPWGITNNIRPGDRPPGFVEAVIYVGSIADYELRLQR